MDVFNLKDVHYKILKEKYGLTRDKFEEMVGKDNFELESLMVQLASDEIDDDNICEIVDAICDYSNN